MTIFQVDGWWPDCKPWTFPLNRVIDCRPIIQERPAPSRSWCDSLIQLLREPGAVSLPAPKPCLGRQDLGLRFIADAETIKVWLNGCGDGVISGLPVAMGFDYTPVLARVRSMLLSPLPKVEYETVSSVRVPLEPPVLLSAPDPPRELEIAATGLADTVSFYAVVPKDGRVHAIFLAHSVARFDSLAAVYASKFLFRPALVGGKPATAYAWINIPVSKMERTTR